MAQVVKMVVPDELQTMKFHELSDKMKYFVVCALWDFQKQKNPTPR